MPIDDTIHAALGESLSALWTAQSNVLELRQAAADIETVARAGTWTLTFDTGASWWSPGLIALFELAPGTAKPSRDALIERIYPDDRAGVLGELATATADHNMFDRRYRMLTGGGQVRDVISRARVYFHPNGHPSFAIGTLIDVTTKNAERKLLDDSTAQLRTMWEYLPEGIVLIALDGTIVDCNPFAEQLLHFTHAEMLGRDLMMLHSPLERARIAAIIKDWKSPIASIETEMLTREGVMVNVETGTSGVFRANERDLVIVSIRDIRDRKTVQKAMLKLAATNIVTARTDLALVRARTRDELLRAVCTSLIGASTLRAWIAEPLQDQRKSGRLVASAGFPEDVAALDIRWDADHPNGRGAFGQCVRTRSIVRTAIDQPEFSPYQKMSKATGVVAVLALPVVDRDGILVFMLGSSDSEAFGPDGIVLYEALAGDIAMGLRALLARDDAHLRASELEAALEGALSAIAAALERRDPATAGHERRVADLAREIGTELGLSEDRLRGLYVAAVVHDIGKIGIPAEIVNKPGLLTELEYAFVKQHAQFGADIMRNIPFPWPIAEIVHQHHEFLDGSGYPRGLAGDAILLEARILTVADVFESMTAFRAYHVGIDTDAALAELRKLAGIHFDAAVVEACARVIARGKFIPFPAPSQIRPQQQLA